MAKSKKKTSNIPSFPKSQVHSINSDGGFEDGGDVYDTQRAWTVDRVGDNGGVMYLLTYTLTKVEKIGVEEPDEVPVADVTKEVL